MSSAGTAAEARIRWVPESLALTYGTGRDGRRWRLRYDGVIWKVEQLAGTWQQRGASLVYRTAQLIAEQLS